MGSMKSVKVSFAALIISAMATAATNAADLPPPVVDVPPEVIPQSYGGWYLRGDIGYSKTSVGGVDYFQGGTLTGKFEKHDISSGWLIGGGIGYQVNDWFRMDVTSNYHFSTDFKGSSAQNVACNAPNAASTCTYVDNGELQITTLMANAYVDLGTYHGFTPYVGAGIGGAYLHWNDITNKEVHVGGPVPGAPLVDDLHGKSSGWRFAWALHTGVSYDIAANWKIDAGYSYQHISSGEMFKYPTTSANVGPQGFHKALQNHTFKVGLRYTFN